ncbi:MAG: MBOAT family protein [Deltaproteobacteria bacterium]|nr:MBOAT family protein [Deltaproteobacteria bacterium]
MQFDSLDYLLLLLATLVGFYGLRGRGRLAVLIIASAVFYGAWSIEFLGLIAISAAVDFSCGLLLASPARKRRWLILLASVVTNLGILGYFKYAGFFVANVQAVFGDVVPGSVIEIVLPPGISFYTFQTMSYTIDVYRGHIRPTRSLSRFFVYVSFFPQLVAGPIERASRLLPQIEQALHLRFSAANVLVGTRMIVWGMFKKVVIADHCARLVEGVYADPSGYDGWAALVATYAFTLQIYCDFSAYSEIARGSARLVGIELMRNFDQPYLVTNMRNFWRHWHISLSEWFRDYVFVPLGGSRGSRGRTLANLTATMFLSGLWHGAAWNFVLWGLFHGVLLLLHALWSARASTRTLMTRLGGLGTAFSWWLTFHLVVVGWVLFRVDHLSDAVTVVGSMVMAPLSGTLPSGGQALFLAAVAGFLVVSAMARRGRWRQRIDASPAAAVFLYGTALVATLVLGAKDGPQFIYFQF